MPTQQLSGDEYLYVRLSPALERKDEIAGNIHFFIYKRRRASKGWFPSPVSVNESSIEIHLLFDKAQQD